MRRLQKREDVSPEVFNHTAQLVRKFVEEYHEQNEEKYIFRNSNAPGSSLIWLKH
jgi:hemerythrin-like domain-containing protein